MTDAPNKGRPRKTKADARSALIAFRVTESERSVIVATAKRSGLSVSDLVRFIATRSFGSRPIPQKRKASADARALAELNRVGVNLHQILRHLNYGGSIPHDLSLAIDEVRAAVAKLAAIS